jgi:hypothetical protein
LFHIANKFAIRQQAAAQRLRSGVPGLGSPTGPQARCRHSPRTEHSPAPARIKPDARRHPKPVGGHASAAASGMPATPAINARCCGSHVDQRQVGMPSASSSHDPAGGPPSACRALGDRQFRSRSPCGLNRPGVSGEPPGNQGRFTTPSLTAYVSTWRRCVAPSLVVIRLTSTKATNCLAIRTRCPTLADLHRG